MFNFIKSSTSAGRVGTFKFENGNWVQDGNDIIGEAPWNNSGEAMDLDGKGNRVAIGAINNQGDSSDVLLGHARIFDLGFPDFESNNNCFTLNTDYNPNLFILEGDFTNSNIFILDENENVVQFLLNFNDKITVDITELPQGLHFIRVEHQQFPDLSIQKIIKQ